MYDRIALRGRANRTGVRPDDVPVDSDTSQPKRLSQRTVYYTVSSSRRSCSARRGLDHQGPYVYVMSTNPPRGPRVDFRER